MHSKNSNGSRAAWTPGFMAFFAIMLAMGLGALASTAAAQPFPLLIGQYDTSTPRTH